MILEQERASAWQYEVESKPGPDDAMDQTPDVPELLRAGAPPPPDGDTHVEELHTVGPAITEPAADQHEAERLYADLVRSATELETEVPTYREADPAEAATPDHSRFYDPAYRPQLRKMLDHVVAIEGPIYFDTLVGRVARAHGFQRARGTIREIIRSSLGRGRFAQTQDDGKELIWPVGADASVLCPWRGPGPRHHHEIPLVELASLAKVFEAAGYDDETIIRTMQETFGLGRLKAPTRERFQRAVEKARQN
jgi:hypothetical protein